MSVNKARLTVLSLLAGVAMVIAAGLGYGFRDGGREFVGFLGLILCAVALHSLLEDE